MHPVTFTPAARLELIDAQDWYAKEASLLARRFRVQIEVIVERIGVNPWQFPSVYKNVRRALLQYFPYALMFVIEPDESVLIIACFHGSRDPVHWQKRL